MVRYEDLVGHHQRDDGEEHRRERELGEEVAARGQVACVARATVYVRQVCYDCVRPEQQTCFQRQSRLVVQQVLPGARGKQLRQHNCNGVVRTLLVERVYVRQQRPDQRAEWRLYDHEGHICIRHEPVPLLVEASRFLAVFALSYVHGRDVGAERAGVRQRTQPDLVELSHGHDDRVVVRCRVGGHIGVYVRREVAIVPLDSQEHQNQDRYQHDNNPGTEEELRGRRDNQHYECGDGADTVHDGAATPTICSGAPPPDDHSKLRQRERQEYT